MQAIIAFHKKIKAYVYNLKGELAGGGGGMGEKRELA